MSKIQKGVSKTKRGQDVNEPKHLEPENEKNLSTLAEKEKSPIKEAFHKDI